MNNTNNKKAGETEYKKNSLRQKKTAELPVISPEGWWKY